MKKKLFIAIGVLAFVMSSCNPKSETKTSDHLVLAKNIEYDVTINNYRLLASCLEGGANWFYSSIDDIWFMNNLEPSVRVPFINLLFENALKGKLELLDLNNKPIDTTMFKKMLFYKDTLNLMRTDPPYDEFDTIIQKKICETADITALRFREEWTYNPKTMAIDKKVIAIAPIISPDKNNAENIFVKENGKPLFWIKFSKETPANTVLTKRITSTVAFFREDNVKALNMDSVLIEKYIATLLSKVKAGSITAYFPSDEMTNEIINTKDVNEIINGNEKDHVKITDIRFIEEWYFDPNTMYMQKKVVGIGLLAKDYDTEGRLRGYRSLFRIFFRDVWMPFDKKLDLAKK